MGCFERLVKSHFLANVSAELSLARKAVQSLGQISSTPMLFLNERDKKEVYAELTYQLYLIEDMVDTLRETKEDKRTIYYCQTDSYIFVYSRDKKQVQEAIRYSYNLNGDIPLCKARHRVFGKYVYTALIDTRIQFVPFSPN